MNSVVIEVFFLLDIIDLQTLTYQNQGSTELCAKSGTVLYEVKHSFGCSVSQQWPNFASKSIVKDFARNMDAEMISKACKSVRAKLMKVPKMKDGYFEHFL